MKLKGMTLQSIIDAALENIPDTVDKRTGSIVYDTIASVAVPILMLAMEANEIENATFIDTSYGEYLERLVASAGIERLQATKSKKLATFLDMDKNPADVPAGTRFLAMDNNLIYSVLEPASYGKGTYIVECESVGTQGNLHYGPLVIMDNSLSLSVAEITEDYSPAIDTETDEELRTRYLKAVKQSAFGGNIAQYEEEMLKMEGVGAVQIYRASKENNMIIISVIDSNQNPVSDTLLYTLQNKVCPGATGTGLGIAPIGHSVQIAKPHKRLLDVEASIKPMNGYTVDVLKNSIKESIETVFKSVRDSWGSMNMNTYSYSDTIYISRIMAAIQNVEGVESVTSVKLDGNTTDYKTQATYGFQDILFLNEVVLNVI